MSKKEMNPEEKYDFIANAIRQLGKPNPIFNTDIDVDFATLLKSCDNKISGIQSILKNMKNLKRVEYRDAFIKDQTIITLVHDYNLEVKRVDVIDLKDFVGSEKTSSHEKSGY
eukprot:TRINITY_DN5662_c0_g1_i1.p1 TRINITY_DN5662_c0_g1~~TRINITY_DN5662_c0_g1_i1.p1  ORF type:complete len:113 (-),score=28.50 TRINITY_DN5662_c0_g1_i1:79-417(-)